MDNERMPHPLLDFIRSTVEQDLLQLLEIGVDPAPCRERWQTIAAAGSADAMLAFQQDLWRMPSPAAYPYAEPSDEAALRQLLPAEGEPFHGGRERLRDKLAGGWLGRAAGCCLGKPLEVSLDRHQTETICRKLDSWPLRDYLNTWPEDAEFADIITGRKLRLRHRCCSRAIIDHAENDDDLNYPVAALMCLERHGAEWTPGQLFKLIADITPWGQLWSSGKNGARAAIMGLGHPAGQLLGNPTRQSLGAMIRCDVWAWVSPGNLRAAAEFALRDALFTQTRNGIYAGVFWTVAIAAAMDLDDPVAAMTIARACVPPKSRFAEMADLAFALRQSADWEDAVDEVYRRCEADNRLPHNMRFNHSLLNSALTMLGVLYGEGDFAATIGLAVAGGRDTDCTGATAGSLLGCALGRRALPEHLIAPLHDRYTSDMAGCHDLSFTDLTERTLAIAAKLGRFRE